MSLDYDTTVPIAFERLFDAKLEAYGIRECRNEHTNHSVRALMDDEGNFLWIYKTADGSATFRWMSLLSNDASNILNAIGEVFDVYYECTQYDGTEERTAHLRPFWEHRGKQPMISGLPERLLRVEERWVKPGDGFFPARP